jgi:hypothetical protein
MPKGHAVDEMNETELRADLVSLLGSPNLDGDGHKNVSASSE